MKNINLLFVWTLIAGLQGCAVADVYNMQGMEGRVVDKATQQPLDGVMVVEVWEAGGGFEGHTVDYLPLQEAETDATGRYSFAARGAGKVSEGFLKEDTPWLIYFKPGYVLISKNNRYHPDRRFEYNRLSDWHGKVIELEKFEGTLQQQAKELERFDGVLGNLAGAGRRCLWMGIPKTLAMVRNEDTRLTRLGVDPKVGISAPWRLDELRKCRQFEMFYGVYENELD